MAQIPEFTEPTFHTDPADALAQVQRIYQEQIGHLRNAMQRFVAGETPNGHVRAFYPFVRVQTTTVARAATQLAYGFVEGPGRYETTLTRPDLFARYYAEQFRLLRASHNVELEVGISNQPIPIHFSFAEHDHIEGTLSAQRRMLMRDVFDLPDLAAMDDGIANGTWEPRAGEAQPLSLFTAPRVDYSLHRLRHYTGTAPEWFQNFVLFTNYQFYIDEFVRLGHAEMANPDSEYVAFIEPGNVVTRRTGLPAEAGDDLGSPPPPPPPAPAMAAAPRGTGWTLSQALAAARDNSEVNQARQELAGARADVLSADHAPLPSLTTKASSIDLQHGPGPGNVFTRKRIDKSVGIDWTWERGDKRALRKKAAESTANAAEADVEDTQVQQLQAALGAYYDLLAAQDRLAEVAAIERSLGDVAGMADRRVKAGDLSVQDASRTRIEAERARADTRAAEQARDDAALALAQVTGSTGSRLQAVDTPWPALAGDPPATDTDLAAWAETRADVRAALARAQAAQAALDGANALRKSDWTGQLATGQDTSHRTRTYPICLCTTSSKFAKPYGGGFLCPQLWEPVRC